MGSCSQRRTARWEEILEGYAAGVDTPFSSCWRDLAAVYPDVPVLLSHRGSAETWYRSMNATVLAHTRQVLALNDDTDPMTPLAASGGVRAEIAPERLIEWQPGDGWEPICSGLGLSVPDVPFPHRTRWQTSSRTLSVPATHTR